MSLLFCDQTMVKLRRTDTPIVTNRPKKRQTIQLLRLPVPVHVKKILVRHYGSPNLRAYGNTIFRCSLPFLLSDDQPTIPDAYRPDAKHYIHLDVTPTIHHAIVNENIEGVNYAARIVDFLDHQCFQLMVAHVTAQMQLEQTAVASIYRFFELYGVTEDDYPFLNAHKRWIRYRRYMLKGSPQLS